MITEDYCDFETAQLLKEKGFDGNCRARYDYNGALHYEKYPIEASGAEMHNSILCPTIQMVCKWLREIHNITIGITFSCNIITYKIHKNGELITAVGSSRPYENVVEEAINLSVNLI